MKPVRVTAKKTNKCDHKVRIIGDSHLKGLAVRVNQYLNTKYEVSSFIKPGACSNQLVHSQDKELLNLGKKDVIIINGGSNDIGNDASRKGILVRMTQFIQNHTNTNIIVLSIPHRHDLAKGSKPNLEIQAFNAKLAKIKKALQHAAFFEMDFHRKHFTKHGFHLNNIGKEELAKLLALHIDKRTNNSLAPITSLKWKEEIGRAHV
jgi:lysophospholipase L1-like esterase